MPRRRSFVGPVALIGLGLLLLYSSVRSNWGPWEFLWRFWPVILIAWGLGKLWDHLRNREAGGTAWPGHFTGGELGMAIALIVLVGLALVHKSTIETRGSYHFTQTVEPQGARSVHAVIELGAGQLDLSGGATGLVDADCYYNWASQKPDLTYFVSNGDGELDFRQPGSHEIHFGRENRNDWKLRFGDQIPLDLAIRMGAGAGWLDLNGLRLTHLSVEGGAGTLFVDMSGNWKQSVDGRIEGGVGTVTVRLPTNVGVRVRAHGGLGSVNAPGLLKQGDTYVNAAYGTSPVTVTLDIQGGIGTINLESGP